MTRFWRASAIALVALLTLASLASARKKKEVVIYYQAPSGDVWYEVATVKREAPPVYTYTIPESTGSIYVYQAAPPPDAIGNVKISAPSGDSTVWIDGQFAGTTGNIMQVGLEAGSHHITLRDPQGATLFSGDVDVVAGQTTQLRPGSGG
jgi:hypothetical protein